MIMQYSISITHTNDFDHTIITLCLTEWQWMYHQWTPTRSHFWMHTHAHKHTFTHTICVLGLRMISTYLTKETSRVEHLRSCYHFLLWVTISTGNRVFHYSDVSHLRRTVKALLYEVEPPNSCTWSDMVSNHYISSSRGTQNLGVSRVLSFRERKWYLMFLLEKTGYRGSSSIK